MECKEIEMLLFDLEDYPRLIDTYKLEDSRGRGLWSRTFAAFTIICPGTCALPIVDCGCSFCTVTMIQCMN